PTENERGECASELCGKALLDAELREDRRRLDAIACFELGSRKVAVAGLPLRLYAVLAAKRPMLVQEILEVFDSVGLALVAHVPRVQEVRDHDLRTRDGATRVSKPDPEVAVGEMREPLVEPTDTPDQPGRSDDVRAASWDDVRDEQIPVE